MTTSVLWRRLETPGHDACRLRSTESGWQLDGAAVFRHKGEPSVINYSLVCDSAWLTREGSIHGWVGARPVDFEVRHTPGNAWILNGATVPDLDHCVDLDLGFTPATNLIQLRRIALDVGQSADVPVAWLDVPSSTLSLLRQRYERRAPYNYWYESPQFKYSALIEVDSAGFARNYPDLFQFEP